MLTFLPYKTGSAGIKAIKGYFNETLEFGDYNVIKSANFSYGNYLSSHAGPRKKNLLVCWGNNLLISQGHATAINGDLNKNKIINANASYATNKKTFFDLLKNAQYPHLPPFTTDVATAGSWLYAPGRKVLCRTKLSGHSGEGIVIADHPEQLVPAQLYVYYVKKKSEYRAHINKFNDQIRWQEKRLRNGYDVSNPNVHTVRNLTNGWVYCQSDVNPPAKVVQAVEELRNSSGYILDFSAVDIIYNQQQDKAYVLEANTAPGLSGTTVDYYANLFINWNQAVKNS